MEKGYNGKRYWLVDDEGILQDLSAREFALDREAIDEILTLCADLLMLLDPQSLQKQAKEIHVLTTETGKGIQGLLSRPEGLWPFQLMLNSKAFPHSLTLTPPSQKEDTVSEEENTVLEKPKERFFLFQFPKQKMWFNGS